MNDGKRVPKDSRRTQFAPVLMQQAGSVPLWEQHHGLFDLAGVQFGSLLAPRFFRDGIESPPFDVHLDGVALSLPDHLDTGPHQVTAKTLVGTLDAGVHVATGFRADRPTILFHHGIGEIGPHSRFRRLLRPGTTAIDANLLTVRAPFHASYHDFSQGVATLTNLLAMQAVSVTLFEELRQRITRRHDTSVIMSGISLGGFIANLHHINFGTADRYVPLLAGLAEDDVFLESSYQCGVADRALSSPRHLENRLNFVDAFAETDPSGVHPVLARHDRIVRYPVQRSSYNGRPIETIEGGHLTGSVARREFRQHLNRFVERERAIGG